MGSVIAFEDTNKRVLRLSSYSQSRVYLAHRLDTNRYDLFESLEPLESQEIPFQVVQEIELSELKNPMPVFPGVTARLISNSEVGTLEFVSENRADVDDGAGKISKRIATGLIVFFFMFGMAVQFMPVEEVEEQEIAEEEVEVEPKRRVRVQPRTRISTANTNRKVNPNQARPKTSAVLGVLGSLSKGSQKGGIDLGKTKVSAGVGLGGSEGSGGAQTSLYAKGLSNASLGDGSNIKGGGGYGTKGNGGGKAGYGSESLVGSGGTSLTPLSHEATVSSGLDKGMIDSVVRRNLGQIRYCYEQALQGDPSLQGRVTAKWVVNANGKATSVGIRNSSLHSKSVENCIKRRIRGWKFPLPKGSVAVPVDYPFTLKRT